MKTTLLTGELERGGDKFRARFDTKDRDGWDLSSPRLPVFSSEGPYPRVGGATLRSDGSADIELTAGLKDANLGQRAVLGFEGKKPIFLVVAAPPVADRRLDGSETVFRAETGGHFHLDSEQTPRSQPPPKGTVEMSNNDLHVDNDYAAELAAEQAMNSRHRAAAGLHTDAERTASQQRADFAAGTCEAWRAVRAGREGAADSIATDEVPASDDVHVDENDPEVKAVLEHQKRMAEASIAADRRADARQGDDEGDEDPEVRAHLAHQQRLAAASPRRAGAA